MKIMMLSDSILTPTGFANITRELSKRLVQDKDFEVYTLGWNHMAQSIQSCTIMGGEELKMPVLAGGKQAYAQDILPQYFKKYEPDIFWTLLDSLPEDRVIPFKNRQGIQFLTLGEAFKRYGAKPDDLKTLSCKVKRVKSHQVRIKDLTGTKHLLTINRTIYQGVWTDVNGIARRHVTNYPLTRVNSQAGEIVCSDKHSMVYDDGKKLKRITPRELFDKREKIITLNTVPHDRHRKIRRLPPKTKEDYAVVFGAFISEGCVNDEQVIFSNNDNQWLETIRRSMQRLFNKKGSYSKHHNTYNLVFWGRELADFFKKQCGKGAKNKVIPSMVFSFNRAEKRLFLDTAIKGDGTFHQKTGKIRYYRTHPAFSYTTTSPKLCASMTFLLKSMQQKFSIISYTKNKTRVYYLFSSCVNKKKSTRTPQFTAETYTGYIYDLMTGNNLFVDGIGQVITHNTFMLFPWILNHSFAPSKSIMYYPSDGEYFPQGCENILRKYDHSVAMSRFAQKQVGELFNIKSDYIPHATHPEIFKPLTPEEKIASKIQFGIPPDAFVFGDVARNQGRKMLGTTIFAFARFLKNNPNSNAYLLLHTDFQDVAAHSNLFSLAQRYRIENRVRGTGMQAQTGFPVSKMNEIYNAMDVRISTSTGEGFGICSIESMAAEIPNINTDYTTTPELYDYPMPPVENGHNLFRERRELQIGKAGIGVPIAEEIAGTWDVYRGFVDHFKFAEAMQLLYEDAQLRARMGTEGRNRVLKYYSWDGPSGVTQQWKDYLKKVVD